MLKSAIYINVFLLFIMSIFFLVKVFNKKTELKMPRTIIVVYMVFNIISFIIYSSGIIEVDWDFIFLFPISLISFILYIIGICSVKSNNTISNNFVFKKYIILIIIPILIFIIPYIYELYVINNCNYLLKYNYQNGIIQSDDTYIAIINNKPVIITLQKNIFDRRGVSTSVLNYDLTYTNGIEISTRDSSYNKKIIENEDIKKISTDAKERCPSAKGAFIYYFSEGNYAIIVLMSEETYGTQLGEYFYYNNTYIKSINTHGSLESITYYK